MHQNLQKELLQAVRSYLEYKLLGTEQAQLSKDPFYEKELGLFVSLHVDGMLRGCIGYIEGFKPLKHAIFEMAEAAAFHDQRFMPLQKDELDAIQIEISILSELTEISDYHEIILGVDGILLKQGRNQAVFLPQVAPEQGWDLDTCLRHLSRKAGLSNDAYKNARTKFEIFTADVFSE